MSKAGRWRIEALTSERLREVDSLFVEVMGFKRPDAHNSWKFAQNPAGPPLGLLAVDGDRVVGQYALWPTPLRLGSEVVLGAQSLDTMTHPDYQGQGMFTTLANECMSLAVDRGVCALYGFPNPNSYPGFIRKLNWDHTGDIQSWFRPLRPGSHPRIPAGLGPLANLAEKLLPRGSTYDLELRVASVPPTPEDLGPLVEAWAQLKGRCRVDRTPAWLAWRFDPASGMQHEWVTAYRGGELIACAVWGIDLVGGRGDGKLAELLGQDERGLRAVVSEVVRRARSRGCPILSTVTNVPSLEQALRGSGFLRGRCIPLIVRSLTARTLGANIHDHGSWSIVGTDLDTF